MLPGLRTGAVGDPGTVPPPEGRPALAASLWGVFVADPRALAGAVVGACRLEQSA